MGHGAWGKGKELFSCSFAPLLCLLGRVFLPCRHSKECSYRNEVHAQRSL